MNKKISPKPKKLLIILILLCICIASGLFSVRIPLVDDEVWSYTLSNNYDMPFLFIVYPGTGGDKSIKEGTVFYYTDQEKYKEYFKHWHDSKYYLDALSVQPDQKFAYDTVYRNQVQDVHPPLYYFFLHTLCSFFTDEISPWLGFSINIFFYAASLLFLYLIAREMGCSEYAAVIVPVFWGLSAAGINEVLCIRMYMMLSFWMICMTYLTILLIKNFKRSYVLGIVILDILGFLTQYYSYIYAFFITLFTCIFFLFKKQWKKMFGYGFSVLLGVGIAMLIFPATLTHVFSGTFTNSVTGNLLNFKNHQFVVRDMGNWVTKYYTGLSFSYFVYYVTRSVKIILFTASLAVIIYLSRMYKEKGSIHIELHHLKKMFSDAYRRLEIQPKVFWNAISLRNKISSFLLLITCIVASNILKRYTRRSLIDFVVLYGHRILFFIVSLVIIYHLILILRKQGNVQIKLPIFKKSFSELRFLEPCVKAKNQLQRFLRLFSPEFKILLVSLLLTGIVISNACPFKGNKFTARYIFVILPLFSVYIVPCVEKTADIVIKKCRKKVSPIKVTTLISAAFILMSYWDNLWFLGSLQAPDNDFYDFKEKITGTNVIVLDNSVYCQSFAPFGCAANSFYPAESLDEELTREIVSYDSDTPLLLVNYSRIVTKEEVDNYLMQEVNIEHSFVRSYIYPFRISSGESDTLYLYELYPAQSRKT